MNTLNHTAMLAIDNALMTARYKLETAKADQKRCQAEADAHAENAAAAELAIHDLLPHIDPMRVCHEITRSNPHRSCGRVDGHDGNHATFNGNRILATWTD